MGEEESTDYWDDEESTDSSEETSTSSLSSLSNEPWRNSGSPVRVTMTEEQYQRYIAQNRQPQPPMKQATPKPLKTLLGNDLTIPKKRKITLDE